jgi:hypothetical protein
MELTTITNNIITFSNRLGKNQVCISSFCFGELVMQADRQVFFIEYLRQIAFVSQVRLPTCYY